MGLDGPLCRDCYVANPCTCTRYEHSGCNMPFKLFSVVFGPGRFLNQRLVMPLGCYIQVVFGGLGSFQVVLFGLFVGFFTKQIGEFRGVTKKEVVSLTSFKSYPTLWSGAWCSSWRCVIYKESANKVFLQGVVAGSFNALTVAVAGSLLLIICTDKRRWKFDQRLNVQKIRVGQKSVIRWEFRFVVHLHWVE